MNVNPFVAVGIVAVAGGLTLYVLAARRRSSFEAKRAAVVGESLREAETGVVTNKHVTDNLQRALLDRSFIYSPSRRAGET